MKLSIADIIVDSEVCIFLILSLIQIAPIKVNPWSALMRFIGKHTNAELTTQLKEIKQQQDQLQTTVIEHIKVDDERNANYSRNRILEFNTELKRHLQHTEEDFNQILADIDNYNKYCKEHPDYPNMRAVHAVANIEKVYDKCLKDNDFLT